MAYRELKVDSVGVLWRASGGQDSVVIPADGCADLILRDDALLVAGPSTRAFIGHGSKLGDTLGLRFPPGTADVAFGNQLGELRDTHLDAADVLAPGALRRGLSLLRNLRDASTPEAKDVARLNVAAEYARPSAERDWITVAHAAAVRGDTACMLARTLASSERQLQRRMVARFGYGYASFRKVIRAERARVMLTAGMNPMETAHNAGYSDQAHLTREFRRLIGTTPGALSASVQRG